MSGRIINHDVVRPLILTALREGNTRRAASNAAGVSEDTLAYWMKHDSAFADEVRKAEAIAEKVAMSQIAKATMTHWQAAAWWLERRRPKDFGRTLKIEQTVEDEDVEVVQGE
jgi:hypothetical protein